MKKLFITLLTFAFTQAIAQDYVQKNDGTVIKGETKSFDDNILTIQSTDNQIFKFNVNELSKIHIAREDFKMNNIRLENSRFETGEDGLTITLGQEVMGGERRHKNKVYSSGGGSNSSSSSSSNSSSSETETISSNDKAAKATIIFECKVCDKKGKLKLESNDGTFSSNWSFSLDDDKEAFPHKMKIEANKKFDWTYEDKKNGVVKGSLKLGADETFVYTIKP
ncbi:hypothetical protein [Emticicia sp. SJ17W-69]|uniref:hypothetical protein n=1 Tax=Emticicia sp. SJ17W-69 TaxID=3421657 RepID=UPI003EBAFBEE